MADKNQESEHFSLNRQDKKDWVHNFTLFLAPLASMYLIAVVGAIQSNNNLFDYRHFIPSQMVQGAIVLYILNTLLDLIRKYVSDNNDGK